jgi:hypothetical protein
VLSTKTSTFPSDGDEQAADERAAAALALATEGHPVLPLTTPEASGCSCRNPDCGSIGKHPRGGLGLAHASSDPRTVAAWWDWWPTANVGLRCDGMLVVDIDGEPGEESLEHLERRLGRLPATRAQQTGGGRHLLYTVPADVELGNSTSSVGSPTGLHLRAGKRGYIVAPLSVHASGSVYRWRDPEAPVSKLPAAYLEALRRRPVAALPVANSNGRTTAYGSAALRGELERLLRATEGNRNEHLNLTVFRLAQLVAGGEIDRAELEREALAIALLTGLDQTESESTIRSGLCAGLAYPRRASTA